MKFLVQLKGQHQREVTAETLKVVDGVITLLNATNETIAAYPVEMVIYVEPKAG